MVELAGGHGYLGYLLRSGGPNMRAMDGLPAPTDLPQLAGLIPHWPTACTREAIIVLEGGEILRP